MALHPWALTRAMTDVVVSVLSRRLTMNALEAESFEPRAPGRKQRTGGVAVLPIHGVIAPRMNALSEISGGATYEQASQALAEVMANPEVSTIVLDIDSPGGSVMGATEFAREVMKARTKKTIIAQANYEMCSAAYWIGACATEIVASPSSMVGSIGVYSIHEDLSAALEQAGVKLTYLSAGKFKVDGNEAEALSDTARARLQAIVDGAYATFVGDVALGRGISVDKVQSRYGEGSVLNATEAKAAKMIDRIATLDETLARVLPSGTQPLALSAQAFALDTSQEPSPATDQDRVRACRELECELLMLDFA
jgi:signal peptide peptidase SppA